MELIYNWKAVLLKSWTVWLAVLGTVLPDILQVIADNVDSFPSLDDGHKSIIRTVFLVLIPIARIIHQPKVNP